MLQGRVFAFCDARCMDRWANWHDQATRHQSVRSRNGRRDSAMLHGRGGTRTGGLKNAGSQRYQRCMPISRHVRRDRTGVIGFEVPPCLHGDRRREAIEVATISAWFVGLPVRRFELDRTLRLARRTSTTRLPFRGEQHGLPDPEVSPLLSNKPERKKRKASLDQRSCHPPA